MEQQQDKQLIRRRNFVKGSLFTLLGVGVAGAGTLYYARNIEPIWFDITHHQLHLSRVTQAFNGYRLLQISDIHADDTFMTANRLAGLVHTINALQADVIVITGDFVTDYLPAAQGILTELSKLQATDGVFGVLGNHDHPSGVEWVRECLQAGQVQELANTTHTIRRGDQMLHLVGMDDLWPRNRGIPAPVWTHQPLLQQLTSSLPDLGAAILLVHEPDFAAVTAQDRRIDLQLSGHSHGGQVRIPLHGPIFLPPLSRVYPKGRYQIENLIQYTNTGLGMLSPHIRFDCRPEIAVFDLYTS
jgi:predicted MPP superfamily phosphohydrolase